MQHELPPLPYPMDALEPHISKETLEYHYGKHHKTYVDKLNDLIKGTEYENAALEDIIRRADGKIFNNAAQIWNHTFFWNCMTPKSSAKPSGALAQAIDKSFGSFDEFKKKFSTASADLFGSGWTWLVKRDDGSLAIEPLKDAQTPVKSGGKALLTLDVWEHAYYIDYRNKRPDFIAAFWNIVNWDFAAKNLGG
ncbi:MAG TPA: superoxide dismutase [Burkholderiales bacterium]|nr:superoxide dismutase [Burkholderiales bacterium]